MNFNEIQLATLLPDGTLTSTRLTNLASPLEGSNLLSAPLIVKAQLGAQYKLLNIETGSHQKGQRLLRYNKDLKVLFDDAPAIELQDYFVASLTPVENSPVYRLENESCSEVQVISHYPPETFDIKESLVWTESDSALDCKVALYNPASFIALIPSAASALPASLGLGEIAAAVIGIPAIAAGGGGSSTPVPPPPPPTDTTAPSVVISTSATSVKANESLVITFTFSEDIGNTFNWDGTSGDILVTGGTLSALSGTGLTRTAIFTPTPNQSGTSVSISVNAGSYQDAAGNLGLAAASPAINADTLAPKVSSAELSSATGAVASLMNSNVDILNAGDTLFASVNFNDAVFLNSSLGSPTLTLLIGNTAVKATYQSGSGSQVLVFSTQIVNGQTDIDGVAIALNALSLNGATLKDDAGNDSDITSIAVASNPHFVVDTTGPTVAISASVSALKIGETASIRFIFSEDPGTSFVWDGTTGGVEVVGGSLGPVTGTGLTRTAVFTPTPQVANGTASISLASGSYQDAAGNLGTVGISPSISFDTLAPVVTSVALTGATGELNHRLNAGDTLSATVTFNDVVTLNSEGGLPTLSMLVGNGTVQATYASGSGTKSLVFTTTIQNGQTDTDGVALPLNALNLNGATLKDNAGNHSVNSFNAVSSNANYLVDTSAPTIAVTSNVSMLRQGQTATINFTFSEEPDTSFSWNGLLGDLTVAGGSLSEISGTGLTRTAVFTPTANVQNGTASIAVSALSYQDAAGNLGAAGLSPGISFDTLAPLISNLALTGATGALKSASDARVSNLNATDTLTATVTFDDAITVNTTGGSPTLALVIGASTVQATYVSGSGTNALVFTTTVVAFQNDGNGVTLARNALSLNGATLTDVNGNHAIITSAAVTDNANYLVDTTRPTVLVASDTATLNSAQTATITFTFSEDPGNSFTWDGSVGDLFVTGGTLGALSTSGSPLTRTAIFTPAPGMRGVAANVAVNLDSYTDAAGNLGLEAVAGVTDKSANISVNTQAATLTSLVISGADNIQNNLLNAGDVVYVTANYSETVNLSAGLGMPSLKLNIGGTEVSALYASGSGSAALVFAYTVLAAQNDANGIAIVANSANTEGSPSFNLSGRTLTDTAGNNVVNTYSAVADNPSYLVDTTAPTLVSIASSRQTFLSGQTAIITFTFSEDPGSTFTWNGTAGDVTVLEGTLSAISGSGLTRTATFFPTQGITGANASVTVNNNLFTDPAGNLGSGNTLSGMVVNTTPATLMAVQLTSAVGLQNSTLNAGDTVNATAHFSEAQTLDLTNGTPTMALQIGSSNGTATYVSGAGTADLVFSYTVLAGQTDLNGIAINASALQLNGSTLIDPHGNITELPASVLSADNAGYKVDTTAPTLAIASSASTLKSGETANITFTFSEDPGSSFAWNGSVGDVVLTGGTLGAISGIGLTRSAVFTPTPNLASGSGSILVTANSYQDSAGNNGSSAVSSNITLDTLAPSISSLALSSATGDMASPLDANVKLLNATDTLSATVTFSKAVTLNITAGSPTLALVVGSSTVQATYVSGSGTTALVFSATIVSGQNDTDGVAIALNALSLNGATLKDSAGNISVITSIAVANNPLYLVDTTAPTISITSDVATLKSGETASITFTFSEDPGSSFVWVSNAGDVVVSGGTLGNISGTGLTRTATFTPTANVLSGTASLSVNAGTYTDAAGNTGSAGSTPLLTFSTSSPTISQVGLSSATGAVSNLLNAGDVIVASVVFSEPIVLNSTAGSPTLGLTIGSTLVQAAYVSGSGSTDFVFSYTILAGQDDANGIAIPSAALSLNGSTLKSAAGNSVALGNAAVADNILYQVDTTAPNVAITSSTSALKAGETATITFTFSEDPGASFTWNGTVGDVLATGGTLGAISGTGLTRTATFTPTANLASGNASITVAGNSYQDTAGNLGSSGLSPVISIDTLAPAATSVALSSATGAVNQRLNAGDTLSATLTFNDTVTLNTTGGSPTLALLVGSSTVQAAYVSGSGTNALVFTTTIVNGQTDTDGVAIAINALSLNGATLKDSAGNSSVSSLSAVVSNSNYLVDTTAPTVTVTSSAASLKAGDTATITFTFSEDPGASFAWDGTSGDVVITGGSLGAISGTGLTRLATFTPTSNLASSSASIAVTSNSYQDAADNNGSAGSLTTLTVDTLAPSVSSLVLTSATGSVASPSDATVKLLNATDTLSATVTFTEAVTVVTTAGSPTLALVIGSSTVQATYVSGSGTNALVFTTTLVGGQTDTDGVAIALNALTLNGATLKDAAGNSSVISSVAVADNSKYLVDTTSPTLNITSDVATLKAGETAVISFTFSEDPGNSFVWSANAGDVIVSGGTLGNISGTGLLRTATFTPTSNVLSGNASITVNAGTYTDTAGNAGNAGTTPVVTFSTTTPTVSQVGISSATGSLNNLLNAGDVVYAKVVFSEAIVLNSTGGSPTLGLTIGSTLVLAAYVSGSGSTDFVFGYTILVGQDDANGIAIPSAALTLNGGTLKSVPGNSVTLGNASVTDNILYPVDTTAPSVVITSSAATLKSGETSLICFTFSEDPDTSFSLSDITVTGGTLSALTGLGTVRRSTFTPAANLASGSASITVADFSYTDTAGNLGTAGITPSISIDTLAPSISSVALSGSTGKVNNTLNAGDTLSVTATFNDTVILNTDGGVPTFKLSIGASTVYAAYVSGAGTNALVFTTTIVSGQTDTDGVAIPANALLLNGATLKDANGNISSIGSLAVTSNGAFMVDTTSPTVAITSDISSLTVGTTANITFTFSEDPDTSFAWDGTSGDVVVAGGTLSAISGTGLTRTAVFTPTTNQSSGTASITVTGNSYQDTAGNNGAAGTTPTLNLDTLAPTITSLALTGSTGGLVSASDATINNLNASDTLSATVTFNDVITVNTSGGTPYLTLNVGGTAVQAAYVSGSGSNALVFTATVASGHNDSNGVAIGADALNLNGGTLKDASGNNSTLTSVAVTDNAHYLVDTTRPTAAVSSSTSALISGQTATITFTFSEDPGSSFVWNGTSGDLTVTGGTLGALSTTANPLTRTAVLTPTSGVSAGTANVAIALNSYTDAAGNIGQEASAGVTDKTADISVNTTTTTVASVALLSATGIQNNLLNQGDVVSVAVNFTEAVFLNANVGTPSLDLTIGSTVVSAQYASGAGTAQLVFNYTILNAQTDVNGIAINANSLSLNGKVLTDTAGNTPTLTFTAVGDNANYLVDTTAPTLISIASSKSVFLSGETAVITFTFSEDPGSTFTWNDSSGDVTLVNGTLSALTGTGLTRSATFLPTQGLSGGNATITVSNNLYTDSAGNLGSGNTLDGLLLNTTPATLIDVQISSATGVQNNALNAGDVVTVTAHFSEAQTLNTTSGSPTVALQIGSSTVNATYASGAGTANLLFTYTIQAGQTDANGIAIGANALSLNGSTLQDPRANTTTLLAPGTADNSNYTVDTNAPFLSITSNVGQLKAGETANITFTFSEDPGTTFVWNGSTGDVTLSNGTLSAISGTGTTRTAVFTPTPSMNAGTASISVGAGTYQDAAGNNGSAGGTPSLTFDTLAPTVSSIALSSSTGILNSYLNEGDTANVSVTFSEAVSLNLTAGSPTLALLVGSSTVQATYVSGSGTNTLVFTTTIATGQTDTDGIAIAINALSLNGAVLSDLAGNGASTNSVAVASNAAYMVDTLAPSVSLAFNVATLKAGETATLTLTANDKTGTSFTWNGTAGDLTVSGGTLSAIGPFVLSGANYVSTATFTPTAGSTTAGVVSTASAVYTDLAGNAGQVGASASLSIDTSVPTLTSMNITGASGILSNTLNAGDVVQITATFSEAVIVNTSGGSPKVSLNVGSSADSAVYVSGSGTTDLLFNYTVVAGQNDVNGLSYAANALVLNSGTIKDSAGNSAVITAIARADNAAYKVDTTPPTVTITSDMSKLLVGQTANITFTFSEDPGSSFVWDGSAGDITLSNGTLSAVSGTGLTRTAVFTPTANVNSGNATVVVNAGSYTDAAGNAGAQGNTPSMTLDTLGLSIYRVIPYTDSGFNPSEGYKVGAYLYYQEAATINLSGGIPTIDLIIGSTLVKAYLTSSYPTNSQYLFFITLVVAGQNDTNGITIVGNSLQMNGGTIKDASGNNSTLPFTSIIDGGPIVDTTPPTVIITSDKSTLKAGETATITFTASEWINNLASTIPNPTNFTLAGGTLSNFVYVSGLNVETATFTPYTNQQLVNASIILKAGTLRDYGYNLNTVASTSPVILIDTVAPTVSISMSNNVLSSTRTSLITFTFSEDPGTSFNWNGTTGDLSFTGGSIGAISGTGLTRTATFTGPTAATQIFNLTLSVLANSYTDAFGNLGVVGTSPNYHIDNIAPLASGFALSGSGVVNNFLNAGDVLTISVYMNKFNMQMITSGGLPTLALTVGSTVVQASYVSIDVNALTFQYTILAGQTDIDGISLNANGISYNGAILQDTYGNLASTIYTAVANNANYKVDTTAPTVAITSNRSVLLAGQTATITFTFSEDVGTSFTWDGSTGDVSVSGGTLGALSGTGLTRTATFTPTANTASGNANIAVTANSYQDLAGNNGSAGTTPAISIDLVPPTVAITSNVATVLTGQTANILLSFSEDPGATFVWDGTTGDVVVTQGTLGAISGTGLTRTAVFTPFPGLASVAASITVAAGTYNDAAGNAGLAGTTPPLNVNTFKNAIYLDDIAANIGGYAIESPNINAKFGYAVSMAGDFNGDGYSDVVMGAPLNTFTDSGNATHTDAGAAVLYEGGLNTSLVTKGYSGTGQVNGHYYTYGVNDGWFGFTVAGMGDVNNDGLADLLIGMPQGSSNPGGAFLVYGKANSTAGSLAEYQNDVSALSTTPAALSITSTFDSAGFSVSSAGDVNGDGWIDMIISAHFQSVGSLALAGKTYVIYGGAWLASKQTISLDNVGVAVPGFVISGWEAGEESGTSVSSAGDFNGDGLADLLVGSIYNNAGGQNSGATYVVLGKTDNTAVNLSSVKNNIGGFVIKGENAQDKVGVSVSSGGDINGDGIGDIIIGAIIELTGTTQTARGKTYVVFGSTAANATIDLGQIASGVGGFAIVSSTNTEQSGHSVSSAGDINGDGLADIILGAPYSPVDGGASTGRSYVVYGKASTTNVSLTDVTNNIGGFAIIGQGAQDLSGFSVGAAGDVNGDGLADLIVGAPGYDSSASSTSNGRSYIIFGSKTGPFAAGTAVDNIGTSANDTLTSTGSQTLAGGSFSAGTGNDTFIASGADVLLGGMGKDTFTVNASMITALQSNFGAGGNTTQLAKIDGGAGIDTLRLGGTGGLNLNLSLIGNSSVGNIEGSSRINSIERIDLSTDTSANELTIRVADVLDMAGSNWANLSTLNSLGAGGWGPATGGSTGINASVMNYHQVAVTGGSNDKISTTGWTLNTTGNVLDSAGINYSVYTATSGAPAMLLVQTDIQRSSIL